MCPLFPFHYVIMYLLSMFPLWIAASIGRSVAATSTQSTITPSRIDKLMEGTTHDLHINLYNFNRSSVDRGRLVIQSMDNQILEVSGNSSIELDVTPPYNATFTVKGNFLGYTSVKIWVRSPDKPSQDVQLGDAVPVSVIREPKLIDKIFVISVATVVALNYINLGATLDWNVVKDTIRMPIGPIVGLVSQFLFMPLISFGLAYLIFPDPTMRLGLFVVGCSPGGGASNMWTYLLGGNLNLSITMTFISNVVSLVTMPLWLFSLGHYMYSESDIKIPYMNVVTSLAALIIPTAIGLIIQRFSKRTANFCTRILGGFSILMIIYIVTFGIYANLFMLKLISWPIVIAGLGVPWLGYFFGMALAVTFRFTGKDVIAIAVETGIQNTGIAIILLRLTLPQPAADLTSVIPVVAATMMPFPLLTIMLVQKVRSCWKDRSNGKYLVGSTSDDSTFPSVQSKQVSRASSPDPLVSNGNTYRSTDETPKY